MEFQLTDSQSAPMCREISSIIRRLITKTVLKIKSRGDISSLCVSCSFCDSFKAFDTLVYDLCN